MTKQFLLDTLWPYLKVCGKFGQFPCKKVYDINNKFIGLKALTNFPRSAVFWLLQSTLLAAWIGSMYYLGVTNNASAEDVIRGFLLFSINETTTEFLSFQVSFWLFSIIPIGLKLQQSKVCHYLCLFQDFTNKHMQVSHENVKLTNYAKWYFYTNFVVVCIGLVMCVSGTLLICCDELNAERSQVLVLFPGE